MLADILHSLANDASDSDGVAQLVVTALGSCGQHYICWKTHSGEYKQQSHGLTKQLQDWLFPTDGSTRDFETLQVILSGEDTFWASDRNGEVRSEPPSSQQRLRRALTFNGENLSTTGRRRANSRARELSTGERGDLERPRSSTLPSLPPTVDHLPGPHLKLSATHSRSSSADKLRRISLVPLAFHQKRRSWATRPRSMVYGHDDLGVLKEQPSPQRVDRSPAPTTPAPATASNDDCPCGCHHEENVKTHKPGSQANTKPRTGYADASVQTDPSLDPESTDEFQHRRRRHHQRWESSLSASSTVDSFTPSSYASSKRSSFETITTQPDPGESYLDSGGKGGGSQQQHWEPPPNPVIMGRMQDYFRSSTYTLGAALQPQGMV
ncbi:hypothetical protein GGS26DRAFT_67630 [Hypomontagnella submonticulosa]|nr:hypothetical protein GGS26DRAFT_67630 [Hypomontagnella submonticulosa]